MMDFLFLFHRKIKKIGKTWKHKKNKTIAYVVTASML